MEVDRNSTKTIEVPFVFSYHYRIGQYLEKFLDGLKEKKILGIKCPECGLVIVPPRKICGRCHVQMNDWVELSTEGSLQNFITAHVSIKDGLVSDLAKPEILGMIRLDGSDALITARLSGVAPAQLKPGLRVKAVFKDAPQGEVGDIEYFAPIG